MTQQLPTNPFDPQTNLRLDKKFVESYKNKIPNWGFNNLGYVVFKRCVTIDTPILRGDFTWEQAGNLKKNDLIIGFDEFPQQNDPTQSRCFRLGKVVHNSIIKTKVVKITLENKEILYSTPDHPWLVAEYSNNSLTWREAKDLTTSPCYLLKTFDVPPSFIENIQKNNPSLQELPKTIEKITLSPNGEYLEIVLKSYSDLCDFRRILQQNKIYSYRSAETNILIIPSYKEIISFLGTFKLTNLVPELQQRFIGSPFKFQHFVKVVSVEPCEEEREIAVLETSIKTHITAGYPSHNTYARFIEGEDRTEEWHETVERCVNGAQKIGAGYTKEEMERLFDLVFNLKCNFAGRMLWQLGTSTVDRYGLPSLCNCWYVSITEPEDFCFVFEHLMLGGGVGFSVRREHIHELPRVKKNVKIRHEPTKDADFIVPDSRQGWVQALRELLEAYFVTGKSFTYSTILVRGAGERIKGFGGVASGPGHLINMIEKISEILDKRQGKKLRSIDVLDICNIIGACVVAGNVRRSAELAIGDPDDYLYLRAKNWSTGQIPNWRAMSNNSIDVHNYSQIHEDVWKDGYVVGKDGYAKGEPYGFCNLRLAQTKGRTKDPDNPDECEGFNPCVEATLQSYEPCDLAEIYLNNISSREELFECAKLLYKTQKAILTLPSISAKTEAITKKNMRIGLGVTGICQALDKVDWLDECYRKLKQFDEEWSRIRGWSKSIRLTVVKPSGTLSLLAGSTPGIHPGYSRFFIRRVRIASEDKIVQLCRQLNYKIEYVKNFDGTEDKGTVVVEFPCSFEESTIVASQMSAIQQLELVKKLQAEWADQSVSVTIYYHPEELDEIRQWLEANFETSLKSVSFLLHSKHGFTQAPYEEITEEQYKKMIKKIQPLTLDIARKILASSSANEGLIEDLLECSTGQCPTR